MADRQRIVVLVGLPGAGKSTYLAERGITPISSDEIRRWLMDDPTDQSIHAVVFATVRYLLRRRLALGRPVTYIDATNLTPRERRPYIKIGQMWGCQVDAIFFNVPAPVCQERNAKRGRVVPREAIEKLAAKLVPPSVEEGFSNVLLA